ncbi:1-acyl-sn-glycerol-3-phosphate acyltransferase [Ancylobacter dichloromethanicus]|uniref:1-acyl-sn-glycerol-3-phosphate acyltransferase n=1 Tax=Ancylobacter dichloromethanicus TaxID=518825 RepID=A0A9W6JBB4_9HYPH|nr:lysophospholipid acyltransferase family protein [Ancylobacter dichloromethanicus]MBS7552365.1 1-acyl-sn-glycerol-3-phosphate acyltransferase [Ancylobacter dichloromethanicus]GLK74102.1 1-acyl-sn-glycerol-3-phosphate acyltransferase [Ancylobacter dichloromethanicus]
MARLRSTVFLLLLVVWTALLAVTIPYYALRNAPPATRRFSRLWAGGVMAILRLVGLSYRTVGGANRPAEPALYVGNHQSAFETIAAAVLIPDVAIVLKEELYRIPVFGWFLKRSPMIAIDRAGGASSVKKMFREGREASEHGRNLLIFPEGTRRAVDERADFHRGVLLLYKALDLPVVPMVHNAGLFWPARSFAIRPGTITVSYLPSIPPGLPDREFMARLSEAIYHERDRLVAEAGAMS